MRTRTSWETAIICAAVVIAIGILSIPFVQSKSTGTYLVAIAFFGVIALGISLRYQYLTVKKRAQAELTGAEQYRQLAEEYRRLSDMAITVQEHTDLKIGDVSAQLDHLREQMASLQNILKDVE
jgi:uncharacterized protein HemX